MKGVYFKLDIDSPGCGAFCSGHFKFFTVFAHGSLFCTGKIIKFLYLCLHNIHRIVTFEVMDWIRAVDRLPGFPSDVIWRRTDNPGDVYLGTNKDGEFWQRNGLGGIGLGPQWYFLVEWLDEDRAAVQKKDGEIAALQREVLVLRQENSRLQDLLDGRHSG